MRRFAIRNRCKAFKSYRAARVRSLFNVAPDQGATFSVDVEIPTDEFDWQIGLIVGPSGSGKSTLARRIFSPRDVHSGFRWRGGPIIDEVGAGRPFNEVTAALCAVGLGSCPSWLRPFRVLSVGEQFRAEMARLLLDGGDRVCVDEFTSALDRTVARHAAHAFGKAWRRRGGRLVAVSCHRDIVNWLCPDWTLDTATWTFARRRLRRPPFKLEIRQVNWAPWKMFEPHHYLKLPPMACATCFVGYVGGEPICHVGAGTTVGLKSARLCRLVVMPEWQGAGIGMRFLNHIAARYLAGRNRYGKPMTSIIHTSHPGLAAALRRDPRWILESARLLGQKSDRASPAGKRRLARGGNVPTMGGHLRSVLGFRYVGVRR